MNIGERIKERRLELGMSQEVLAQKCGYKNRSSINKIELSRQLPTNKIKVLADVLCVSPGYLMGWEENNDDLAYIINLYYKLPDDLRTKFMEIVKDLGGIYEKALLDLYKSIY